MRSCETAWQYFFFCGFQDLALEYSKWEFIYNFTDGLDILSLMGSVLGKPWFPIEETPIWDLLENSCFNDFCMLGDCIVVVFRYLDMGLANSSKYPVLAARCCVLLKKNDSVGQLGGQRCITFLLVHWMCCRFVTARTTCKEETMVLNSVE